MQSDSPSRTALATAAARALHRYADDQPLVFDDPIAEQLLPGWQRRAIMRLGRLDRQRRRARLRQPDPATALRAQIVVRSRFAEDALAAAGAARYIVLAAGLDTFGLRLPIADVDVLEVDHPATQRWKQGLLKSRGIPVPDRLRFLPLDFEQESLKAALMAERAAVPQFVSWLGATYYLTREAIADTLTVLREVTPDGSRLVFDYWRQRPPTLSGNLLLWSTRVAVALQNEPMLSFFEPAEIHELASGAGWRVREDLNPAAQRTRYLAGRRDGLIVPSFAHLLELE